MDIRGAGVILMALGALCCLSGAERLKKMMEFTGGREGFPSFGGGALLVGIVMMVIGGFLFARSFLDR